MKIKTIITDFDGVLTDNKVFISADGIESVCCSRADGLAIKAFIKLGIRILIISTETNDVVKVRGNKLNIETFNNVDNKKDFLLEMASKKGIDLSTSLYLGNDINDINAIKICAYSACPSDSYSEVKKIVNFVLERKGGQGVLREVASEILKIDLYKTLYMTNQL